MRKEPKFRVRRILVALDASPHSLAALEAAAVLATSLRGELVGLFVEDINLFRLTELPVARELGFYSVGDRCSEKGELELQLRVQAERARRALARMAERHQLTWSFRIVRGEVAAEVLAAAAESDLVSLGRVGRSLGQSGRMGSTAREILFRSQGLTLVQQPGTITGRPALALHDLSSASRHALAVAAELAQAEGGGLKVFLLIADPEEAGRIEASVSEWLDEQGLRAQFRRIYSASGTALAKTVWAERRGLLLVPGGSPLLQEEALQTLLDTDCPLLVVR